MLHITSILSHPINPNRAEGLISAFASSDDSGLAYRMFSLSPTFMISTPKQLTILTETTNRNNNPEQLIPNERTGACGITTITRKYTKKKECLPACPPASQPENQKHHHQSQPQPSSVALEEKKRKKNQPFKEIVIQVETTSIEEKAGSDTDVELANPISFVSQEAASEKTNQL